MASRLLSEVVYYETETRQIIEQNEQGNKNLSADLEYWQQKYQDFKNNAIAESSRLRYCLKTLRQEHEKCPSNGDFYQLTIACERALDELEKSLKQLEETKVDIEKCQGRINSLGNGLRISQQHLINEVNLNSNLTLENNALWTELAELDEEIGIKNQRIAEIIRELSQTNQEKNDLQAQLTTNSNLTAQLTNLNLKLQKIKQQASYWKAENKNNQEQLNNSHSSRTYWKQKAQEYKKKWKKSQQQLKQEQISYRQIRNQLTITKIERDNYKNQWDNHTCPIPTSHTCPPCSLNHNPIANCSHSNYNNLQSELVNKNQRISELEIQLKEKDRIIEELRNKPPVIQIAEVDKEPKLETKPNILPIITIDCFDSYQNAIKRLQLSSETKEKIKEIPVLDLKVIQGMQNRLKDKKQTIKEWKIICLVSLVAIIILGLNTVRLMIKGKGKKD